MTRDQHSAAVAFAQAEIEALKNRLIAAAEKQELCLDQVVQAVGDSPQTEAGRMAFEWTASLADRISELIRIADNVHTQLSQYAEGF
jgi:hypothetical protein